VNEEGDTLQWEFCLFIIADCGADVIIGYPTLEKGKIIQYNPPCLQAAAKEQTSERKAELQAKAVETAQSLHLYYCSLMIDQCS
jgi:hypothetical protein